MTEVLGFRLIDETVRARFLHAACPDHFSLALVKHSNATLNHIAFDMPDLNSVMRGAGRMRDAGYPIEWGVGRHGPGNNVFAYFAGPEEIPLEYTSEVLQIDDTYVPRGPDFWKFPPGRSDQWGVTNPQTARLARIQQLFGFSAKTASAHERCERTYEVAVVGCGPVGAIAANLFGHAGLRTLVVEREAAPYPLPRAVHIDHEMMRIFQSVGPRRCGAAADARGAGPHPHRRGWRRDPLSRFGRTAEAVRLGQRLFFLSSPNSRPRCRRACRASRMSSLRRGVALTALEQTQDGVTLTLHGADGERQRAMRAMSLPATARTASCARRSASRLPICDFTSRGWSSMRRWTGRSRFRNSSGVPAGADLQHLSVMLCDPRRPATLVPGRGNHRRWEFMLLPGERRCRDDAAGARGGADRALCGRRAAPDHPRGDLPLSRSGRGALAAGPRVSRRRCRAPDAAVLRAGHVPRHARCRESRLEIRRGAAAAARTPALHRHLSGRTRTACACRDRGRDRGRALHLRARSRCGAQARDETLRAAMGKPAPGERERPDPADPRAASSTRRCSARRDRRALHPAVCDADGRRMLLDDATGGGFVLLASSPDMLAALGDPQRATCCASWRAHVRAVGEGADAWAIPMAILPAGLQRMRQSRCCCAPTSMFTASRAIPPASGKG